MRTGINNQKKVLLWCYAQPKYFRQSDVLDKTFPYNCFRSILIWYDNAWSLKLLVHIWRQVIKISKQQFWWLANGVINNINFNINATKSKMFLLISDSISKHISFVQWFWKGYADSCKVYTPKDTFKECNCKKRSIELFLKK